MRHARAELARALEPGNRARLARRLDKEAPLLGLDAEGDAPRVLLAERREDPPAGCEEVLDIVLDPRGLQDQGWRVRSRRDWKSFANRDTFSSSIIALCG